jgi:NifB/MoaA-like Fe-S oxidoreductase
MLDDWAEVRRTRPPVSDTPITVVCATLIAPVLEDLALELSSFLDVPVSVLPVVNETFGEQVTVSGLLTGKDVRAALERERPTGRVFLPRAMFDDEGELTLDDLALPDMGAGLNVDLRVAETLGDVVQSDTTD